MSAIGAARQRDDSWQPVAAPPSPAAIEGTPADLAQAPSAESLRIPAAPGPPTSGELRPSGAAGSVSTLQAAYGNARVARAAASTPPPQAALDVAQPAPEARAADRAAPKAPPVSVAKSAESAASRRIETPETPANETAGAANAPAEVTISGESPGAILGQLAATPPTRAILAMDSASEASATALEQQKEEVARDVPEIPAPTGLPAQEAGARAERPGAGPAAPNADLRAEGAGSAGPAYVTTVEAPPAAPAPTTQLPGPEVPESEAAAAEAARRAQATFEAVDLPSEAIPVSAGERPRVDATGDADPSRMVAFEQQSAASLGTATQQAALEASADFGENGIYPQPSGEMLGASLRSPAPRAPGAELPAGEPLPPEAAAFDQSLAPVFGERIGAEQAKYEAEEQRFTDERLSARVKADADRGQLEANARETQLAEQGRAKETVAAARGEWRGEIAKVETDFNDNAGKAGAEQRGKVETERSKGEREAARHLQDAEKKALAEKRAAEEDAEAKKKEAKEESQGFWGWAKRAVSALIDGLKAAVNFIYDNLRKAVKLIFEAAKALALAAIELARAAVVLVIKAYGVLLKGFVSIALAAFPKLRDRINAKIDKAIAAAVSAVNTAAEWVKKGVAAVLDFLASTLDSLLGLIQSIYNGIFTVIGMIVRGEFQELMRRLWNLVEAAKTAPEQFETAALEELLGGNLDEPLSPAELMQAGISPPAATRGQGGGVPAPANPSDIPRPPWTTDNVGVDDVEHDMQLSPELAQDLVEKTEGGEELELDTPADPSRTMSAVMSEATAGNETTETTPEIEAKNPDDGLTPAKRAAIKWDLMKTGISNWWSEKWPVVLAGAAAAVLGFIALNIVTGGAITAALPAIMAVVGPLFIGLTVLKLVEHVKVYVEKGWAGELRPAGKSLAKGLAAGAIELISYLTFKAGGALLRGAKALAKGGVGLAKAGVGLAKAGLKTLARGAKFVIQKGKVLFRGIAGTGLGKRVRSVAELGERLLERVRFRKFKITLNGRRFKLWGYINPWALMADGTIEEIHVRGRPKLGKVVRGKGGQRGIVVGVRDTPKPSGFVDELAAASKDASRIAENKALYDKLAGLSYKERRALLTTFDKLGFSSTTDAMRKAVQGKPYRDPFTNKMVNPQPGTPIEPDHVFPVDEMTKLQGWDKLTQAQKKAIVYDDIGLGNIKPLPKVLNRSKQNKLGLDWSNVAGKPINPAYRQLLFDEQMKIQNAILKQIEEFLKQTT